jgi:S-adenosyl-L-methionine hydrolase (adenosine-forming)
MKGVILTIAPSASIVDVTHEIEKFNIKMGAFILASAAPYFPKGTVHLAVIDPGVGTERRGIVIETNQGYFVGPDNGLLMLAAETQKIIRIHQLTNPKLMLPKISGTFHGRDVFAPAAAYLQRGVKPEEFGLEIKDAVKPEFAQVQQSGNCIIGRVLMVDSFGNIITNISSEKLTKSAKTLLLVNINNHELKLTLKRAYGEVKPAEALALIGSHGFLEIALNQGNAAEKYQAKMDMKITVSQNSR